MKVNIVSPNFWKQINECRNDVIRLNSEIEQGFTDFQAIYKKKKPMRKLIFYVTLGTVELTLNFDDGESI
jgi:hypothetical protein